MLGNGENPLVLVWVNLDLAYRILIYFVCSRQRLHIYMLFTSLRTDFLRLPLAISVVLTFRGQDF